MLGRANREVWRNCPASEKVEHGYVCGETIKAEYCRRAIEDLSPEHSDVYQSRQGGDGGEGIK